jgi:hypothetical protein
LLESLVLLNELVLVFVFFAKQIVISIGGGEGVLKQRYEVVLFVFVLLEVLLFLPLPLFLLVFLLFLVIGRLLLNRLGHKVLAKEVKIL